MTLADPRAEIRAALKCLAKAAKIEDAEWSYPDGFSGARGGDFMRWVSRVLSSALAYADQQAQEIQRLREENARLREALGDTTAMCRSASTWPADDVQGMRYHALERAKAGMDALSRVEAEPTREERG